MATDKVQFIFWTFLGINFVHCVVHPDGLSKVSRYQDDLGNFEFGYTVADSEGEHFHKAEKDALGRVVGSYGLTNVDGRHRIVDYVADHNGFRAHVRSNEPGIVSSSSDTVTVEKTGLDALDRGLDFAASSDSGTKFGDRLRETSSRVTYSRPREDVDHYNSRRISRPVSSDAVVEKADGRARQNHNPLRERTRTPSEHRQHSTSDESEIGDNTRNEDHLSLLRYQPPIDPFRSGPQPLIPPPARQFPSHQQALQPSTPPYGGIETRNPLLDPVRFDDYPPITSPPPRSQVTRYPVVSMSTVHGGIGDMPYLLNPSSPERPLLKRDNIDFPPGPLQRRRYEPNYGRSFSNVGGERLDPSRRPNLVLRAVAIPNGIQAVHVDSATGQIYNNPEFKVYDPNDKHDRHTSLTSYDRNSPNSDGQLGFSDDRFPAYSPSLPGNINPRSHRNYSSYPPGHNYRNYRGAPDETSLSRPSAKDQRVLHRVFDHINHNRESGPIPNPHNARHPSRPHTPNTIPYLHESRPDYPPSVVYPENGDYFSNFRRDLGPHLTPRELSAIFPLTFGRPSAEFPEFDEPPFFSRGYRSVPEEKSSGSISTKADAVDKRSKP